MSKKVKYKTNFQDIWLENEDFKLWLKKVENNPHMARCKVCAKDISIATHGITALITHAKGSKHQERLPKMDPRSFFGEKSSESSSSKRADPKPKQSTIACSANKSLITNAEIIWALDVVMSKYSFNSSSNKSETFSAMFPCCDIVKEFACGKTKCSYIVNHGIAPYFRELLTTELSELEHFVTMFDESHNKVLKQGQMDLHVRFWDNTEKIVASRYYSSEFLGKATALDIYSKFETCLKPLPEEKMIQVSSDGPNVNLKFLEILAEKRKDAEQTKLIDLGTCGLHTVHNAFKHGEEASGWKIKS